MNIFKIIGDLLGIGKGYLENRARLKQAKANQEHEIVIAETEATVDRILNNTESDNSIDLITARNKKYTLKDEILTYLFLMPVLYAVVIDVLGFRSFARKIVDMYLDKKKTNNDLL